MAKAKSNTPTPWVTFAYIYDITFTPGTDEQVMSVVATSYGDALAIVGNYIGKTEYSVSSVMRRDGHVLTWGNK